MRRAAACAALCAASAAALGGEPAKDDANPDRPHFDGDLRVGWRFLSGEDQGRFPQDWGLKDGPRIFDLSLRGTDPRPNAAVDEIEAQLSGIGDANSDYLVTLRRHGVFDLSGGYRRDDYNYRAAGDPFPYDTIRDRSFVRGLWTPDAGLAIRFSWDRSDRHGRAFAQAYSDVFPDPRPPQLADDSIGQTRGISQRFDTFKLGADWSMGIFRFGLTQSVGMGEVEDTRHSNVPPDGPAASESTNVTVRSKTYATSGKAGVVLEDGKLDATLFVTRTTGPMHERGSGIVTQTQPGTQFSTSGEVFREALDWRFETSWRPRREWEFTLASESDDVTDTEVETLFGPEVHARISDQNQRWSADATWDASDQWRLRLGEQYLRQSLYVQTDSHLAPAAEATGPVPTDTSSNSLRTTIGADFTPSSKLTVSALAHVSSNNDPQTIAVPESSDEFTLRTRWKPEPQWSFTSLWRRQTTGHSLYVPLRDLGVDPSATAGTLRNFDSSGRADSVTGAAVWSQGPWSVRGSATIRDVATRTDTAYHIDQSSDVLHFDTVSFAGRNVIANADVRYEFTNALRAFADATRTNATGDYAALWTNLSVGGEYDVRSDVTIGVTVSSWRLNEKHGGLDDYSTYGAEFSVTYKF